MSRFGTDDSRFSAALARERGSEANAPHAHAIIGGFLAGSPATLIVLPCLYMLMVKDKHGQPLHETDAVNHSTFEGSTEHRGAYRALF